MAWLPPVLARNWRLKLAATALAVVLWAVVRADPSRSGDVFTVPVVAQVEDPAWTLAADPQPATVQVRFRGPTTDLIRLAREGASIRIPLDTVAHADTLVQLRRDWVVLGEGSQLMVEDILPAAVRLSLEPTATALVPVRVRTTGDFPSGLALAAPVGLNPPFVRVRGAARRLRALDSVALAPLDLDRVAKSGTYQVDVDTSVLGGLDVDPTSATLALRLEPALERDLPAVPVVAADRDGRPADSLEIVPPTVPVRLAGARTPVTGTDSAGIRAVVPWEALADLGPGQERRVAIRLRGLPPLVRGFTTVDSVTVRRLAGPARTHD